jgi:cytochrome c
MTPENRRELMSRIHVSILVLLLVGCTSVSMTPRTNTRADLVQYVNNAAALVGKNGPSCDAFARSEWMAGDYYIFVINTDGRLACHPTASLVGRPSHEIVDANGLNVGDALVAAATRSEGHGWVEYVWPRPGQTTPVAKSSYVTRVTAPDGVTYIVGSGGYSLQ